VRASPPALEEEVKPRILYVDIGRAGLTTCSFTRRHGFKWHAGAILEAKEISRGSAGASRGPHIYLVGMYVKGSIKGQGLACWPTPWGHLILEVKRRREEDEETAA